jgi:predicted ATP-dependent serine protease
MVDGFQQRSGCFQCGACGRNTRRTAKQGNSALCPQCDEWAMIENGISDGNYNDDAEIAEAEASVLRLKEKAASLGGDRERLGLVHHG